MKPTVEMRCAYITKDNRLRGRISTHHKLQMNEREKIEGRFVTTGFIIGKDGDIFETKNTIYHVTDWVLRK